jgi:hypothetical protein
MFSLMNSLMNSLMFFWIFRDGEYICSHGFDPVVIKSVIKMPATSPFVMPCPESPLTRKTCSSSGYDR